LGKIRWWLVCVRDVPDSVNCIRYLPNVDIQHYPRYPVTFLPGTYRIVLELES
jgi:hypothetical protein